jgi:hypothetical protein
MTVQSAITAAIPPGATLETLSRGDTFEVAEYLAEAMVLMLGPRRTRTSIPWHVWEELGAWLATKGWTKLGAGRGQRTSSESLNGFLDPRIQRSVGSYVAAILVEAGLVEPDHGQPLRIRWLARPGRPRAARSGADAWAQVQAICREAMSTGRTIATIDKGVANRILDVRPTAIVRASDDARTPDGEGAQISRTMVERIWHALATDGHASGVPGTLFFAYALVAEIPGVAVDDDRRGLHIADWGLAMTPYQEGSAAATTVSSWTEGEIQATVTAYFTMLRAELAGEPYAKVDFNRDVRDATGRSRGAVEYKFANISAVLRDIGLPYVLGYQPRGNYQSALCDTVERLLAGDTEIPLLLEKMPAPDVPPAARLLKVDPPVMAPPGARGAGRTTTVVIDYLERHARNRDVGLKGELLVLAYERNWLSDHGRPDLADRVVHVSAKLGDGAGYDVSSFLLDGSPHHIEVKTTRGSISAPFFLSANELGHALEHPGAYSIYRVFNLGPSPQFYKLTGDMQEILDLTPVSYQARVKAPGARPRAHD